MSQIEGLDYNVPHYYAILDVKFLNSDERDGQDDFYGAYVAAQNELYESGFVEPLDHSPDCTCGDGACPGTYLPGDPQGLIEQASDLRDTGIFDS
jgi:hypothetical protein